MAFLKVVRGRNPGKVYEITGERVIFGRHPECDVVLEGAGVSRRHAQILERRGQYFIEDLRSRNGTYVNNVQIENRVELHDDDLITFCDYTFRFYSSLPEGSTSVARAASAEPQGKAGTQHGRTGTVLPTKVQAIEDESSSTSIISSIDAQSSARLRVNVNPEVKLKALLEISRTLARTLDLNQVLDKILEALFSIFPQADEGFVLLRDPETKKLRIRASRVRHGQDDDVVRISKTIVNQAMESGQAILSANAPEDSRFSMSESIDGLRIKSMICAPLTGAGTKALGVIQIATWDLQQQFSEDDLDVLVSVAAQACLAIENAYLHQTALRQRDLERELEFAMQVQLGFLPKTRPKLESYSFFDHYEAAQRVGGDFFDYVTLSDGRVVVSLADVAGKGVPAALLMARLYSSARFYILSRPNLCEALAGLNQELTGGGLGHRFVTFVMALIDPETHHVTVANAGHLPPLKRSADKTVEQIARRDSGLPLGINPSQQYRDMTLRLEPGETVLFYTDGVTEAMNPKRELYGSRRLREFVASGPSQLPDLIEGIIADVEAFCEGRPQSDDICLVGFTRTK